MSVYLDDLLVTRSTVKEHLENLDKLRGMMATAGLTLNQTKCKFCCQPCIILMLYFSIMHTILLTYMVSVYLLHYLKQLILNIIPTLYYHIYGFSLFNTLTKALHEIVSIIQVISSFFVFNKPLEIPSYIPLFSQCKC